MDGKSEEGRKGVRWGWANDYFPWMVLFQWNVNVSSE